VLEISADQWADFTECGRRWDYASPHRRNLQPAEPLPFCDLGRALHDALAVYYFPGMWDWPRAVVNPLVVKALERSVAEQRARAEATRALSSGEQGHWDRALQTGRRVIDGYIATAPGLDPFAPVLVETEYRAPVPVPGHPDLTLAGPDGVGVDYVGRADALVIDGYDGYWILRHRVVEGWTPVERLMADEGARAACWAWARFYLGMAITGTIDNELSLDPPAGDIASPRPEPGTRVAQSEGSGGGRSVPQHRRLSARAREPDTLPVVTVDEAPGLRRVWIRRSPEETDATAARLAADLARMVDPATAVEPNAGPERCGRCPFLRPCLEVSGGADPDQALATGFRPGQPEDREAGRLGTVTWSTGRGAAPPQLGGPDR
jgi:hypothetical protein